MLGIYGKYTYYYTPSSCDATLGREGFCVFQKMCYCKVHSGASSEGQVAFSIINLFLGVHYFVIKICLGLKYGIYSLSSASHSLKKKSIRIANLGLVTLK